MPTSRALVNGWPLVGGQLNLQIIQPPSRYTGPLLGVYSGNTPGWDQRFQDFMGGLLDEAEAHGGRVSQSDMVGSTYVIDASQWPGKKGLTIPLCYTGQTLQAAANGDNDATWILMAQQLLARRGFQDVIPIRPGWEFNHSFQEWGIIPGGRVGTAFTAAQLANFYATAYARCVACFKSVSPKFYNIWCINNGVYDFKPAFPGKTFTFAVKNSQIGDKLVDEVGLDVYSNTTDAGSTDPIAVFNFVKNRQFGIKDIVDFADAQSLPWSINEWGVNRDDFGPYVRAMYDYAASRNCRMMSWWDSHDAYDSKVSDGSLPTMAAYLRNCFNPAKYPQPIYYPNTEVPNLLVAPSLDAKVREVGTPLDIFPGVWGKQPSSYTWAVKRDGVQVASGSVTGFGNAQYTPVVADIGQNRLDVTIVPSNSVGAGQAATSPKVPQIFPAASNVWDISDYGTNSITAPKNFADAGWDKSGSLDVLSGYADSDAGTTATFLREQSGTKDYSLRRTLSKPASRVHQIFRADLKPNGRKFVKFQIGPTDYSSSVQGFVDISTGSILSSFGSANSNGSATYYLNRVTCVSLGNGFYRLEVDLLTDASVNQIAQITIVTGNNDYNAHAGDTTKGIIAQFFSMVNADEVVAAPTQVPTSITAPIVFSGDVYPGTLATTSRGVWANQPSGYSVRWYKNDAVISGETGQTYLFRDGDVGADIQSAITTTNAAGSSVEVKSAKIRVTTNPNLGPNLFLAPKNLQDAVWSHGYVSAGTVTATAVDTVAFSGDINQQFRQSDAYGFPRPTAGSYRLTFTVQRVSGDGNTVSAYFVDGSDNEVPFTVAIGETKTISRDVTFDTDLSSSYWGVGIKNTNSKPVTLKFIPDANGDYLSWRRTTAVAAAPGNNTTNATKLTFGNTGYAQASSKPNIGTQSFVVDCTFIPTADDIANGFALMNAWGSSGSSQNDWLLQIMNNGKPRIAYADAGNNYTVIDSNAALSMTAGTQYRVSAEVNPAAKTVSFFYYPSGTKTSLGATSAVLNASASVGNKANSIVRVGNSADGSSQMKGSFVAGSLTVGGTLVNNPVVAANGTITDSTGVVWTVAGSAVFQ